jgi:transcriptional regulator
MKGLSLNMKSNYGHKMIQWRRDKVLELSSQGHSQTEIANILQVSEPTVSTDLSYFRVQAKDNIRKPGTVVDDAIRFSPEIINGNTYTDLN